MQKWHLKPQIRDWKLWEWGLALGSLHISAEWKQGQLGKQKTLLCDGKNLIQKYYWKHCECSWNRGEVRGSHRGKGKRMKAFLRVSQQNCHMWEQTRRVSCSYALKNLSSVQSLSHVRLCNSMDCNTPTGFPVLHISLSLLKLMSIELVMPSNHLILCRTLLLSPSILPSIRVFSNESVIHIRWPKYWSISFNISPPNEHSGLISFRVDWLDLLAAQGTLESSPTPQFKNISYSGSAFFIVQLHTWLLEKP